MVFSSDFFLGACKQAKSGGSSQYSLSIERYGINESSLIYHTYPHRLSTSPHLRSIPQRLEPRPRWPIPLPIRPQPRQPTRRSSTTSPRIPRQIRPSPPITRRPIPIPPCPILRNHVGNLLRKRINSSLRVPRWQYRKATRIHDSQSRDPADVGVTIQHGHLIARPPHLARTRGMPHGRQTLADEVEDLGIGLHGRPRDPFLAERDIRQTQCPHLALAFKRRDC